MEIGEGKLQEPENTIPEERTKVGFPEQSKKGTNKSSRNLVIFLIIVLLLLGGGAWYLFGTTNNEEIMTSSPTPTTEEKQPTVTPTIEPDVDKSEIKIQVLNGSGIKGGAGDLQGELESLDFQNVDIGNASNQDNTKTTVSYEVNLSESIKDEITKKLESIYEEVVVETKTISEFDVMIITGFPKGYEATSTPTEEITATATPTESPTSTPTEAE